MTGTSANVFMLPFLLPLVTSHARQLIVFQFLQYSQICRRQFPRIFDGAPDLAMRMRNIFRAKVTPGHAWRRCAASCAKMAEPIGIECIRTTSEQSECGLWNFPAIPGQLKSGRQNRVRARERVRVRVFVSVRVSVSVRFRVSVRVRDRVSYDCQDFKIEIEIGIEIHTSFGKNQLRSSWSISE